MLMQDFDNGLLCPASADDALPPGTGCVSEAVADFDGDGTADRFLLYAELKPDGTPARWRALVVLSSSGTTKPVPVPTGQGVATIYPRVIGAADPCSWCDTSSRCCRRPGGARSAPSSGGD